MRSEGYCSWVCLCVCLLSHISPMERLCVLKTLSRTQRATKVKKFCGVFSETAPLQRSSTPSVVRPCVQSAIFPCVFLVYAHAYFSCIYAHDTPPSTSFSYNYSSCVSVWHASLYRMRICTACVFLMYAHAFLVTRMIHRRGFSTLVLFIIHGDLVNV